MNTAPTNMVDLLRVLGTDTMWSPIKRELTVGDVVVQIVTKNGDLVYYQTKDEVAAARIADAIKQVKLETVLH